MDIKTIQAMMKVIPNNITISLEDLEEIFMGECKHCGLPYKDFKCPNCENEIQSTRTLEDS